MENPPRNFHICPSCGTEFWNDDEDKSHAELRREWVVSGAPWFFGDSPAGWNPWIQLMKGGYVKDALIEFGIPAASHEASYETFTDKTFIYVRHQADDSELAEVA